MLLSRIGVYRNGRALALYCLIYMQVKFPKSPKSTSALTTLSISPCFPVVGIKKFVERGKFEPNFSSGLATFAWDFLDFGFEEFSRERIWPLRVNDSFKTASNSFLKVLFNASLTEKHEQ